MDLLQEQMRREQEDKLERYRILNRNVRKGEILFTGSSLMEQFPINELLMTNNMRQVIYKGYWWIYDNGYVTAYGGDGIRDRALQNLYQYWHQ